MASTWKLKSYIGKKRLEEKHLYYYFQSYINGESKSCGNYVCRVYNQNHVSRMKTFNESENILIRYARQFTKDPN